MAATRAQASTKHSALLPLLEPLPAGNPELQRDQIRDAVAVWRAGRQAAARAQFERDGDAAALLRELSDIMDETVAALFKLLMPGTIGVAVLATGGYGRRQMFPYSDVDLLFLFRPAARQAAALLARTMLYVLWDIGLKVGHALRSVDDTLALSVEDYTIRTGLLDARIVAGDVALAEEFCRRFREEIVAGTAEAFVEEKLRERDNRHQRLMDSRYLLEPNIKESKGGLRDLHTLYWIAKYVYGVENIKGLVGLGYISAEEYRGFEKARRFLWELRVRLHYLAGKAEERLSFDRQQALAPLMGYQDREATRGVERLMKHYFLTASEVGHFTGTLCALLEDSRKRKPRIPLAARLSNRLRLEGFTLDGGRLNVRNEAEFEREPLRMLKLFAVAQAQGCDIHPKALQLVARSLKRVDAAMRADAAANALFMDILLSRAGPEQTLRRMNEVGLLGKFIPEFGRIKGQMQFNMYHIYTVDEHTIVALGNLFAIEQGRYREEMPVVSDIARHVQSRRVLYLALLVHDVAKGQGDDHSAEGAKIALKMARRFGFSDAEAEMTAWLVQHHLLFTHTAFKRDAADPQTVRDFVGAVQTVERLRLLFCLTIADMRAVAPSVWNAWKATLLRDAYRKAEAFIRTGAEAGDADDAEAVAAVKRALKGSEAEIEHYMRLCPAEYISAQPPEAHARVMELLARQEGGMALDIRHDKANSTTALTVVTQDQPALFSKLSGAISLAGANIVTAKIFTLKSGMAVDVFHVQDQDGNVFHEKERLARVSLRMRQAITGEIDVGRELAKQKLPARRDAFKVAGQVFVENDVSATHTVVEVEGRDRMGFLHAVTKALADSGLTIGSAHISTYGARVVDVFYVRGAGGKLSEEQMSNVKCQITGTF